MMAEANIKQKILALLVVFFIFLLIGILFFGISLNNREKTDRLYKAIESKKQKEADLSKLALLTYATTTEEITSRSFLALAITDSGEKKILNQKNSEEVLPIASITKLMVAVVVLENVDLEVPIKASTDFIGKEESAFILEMDHTYQVKDLLANALISSDNDSARLLSATLGEENFLVKMNTTAQKIGMTKTNYFNVTGLDPQAPDFNTNISSANDLARLLIYIKDKHPEILKITKKTQYNFCDINNYCKLVISTNKLLDNKIFPFIIIGGKTGSTDLAGKNLVLVSRVLDGVNLISIVLGSNDNFADTLSLINQVKIEN